MSKPYTVIKMPRKTKESRAAYMREYRRTSPEWRERHREWMREWRKRNPNKDKEYRQKSKERRAIYKKDYRKNNPEKVKARSLSRSLKLDDKCSECGSTENLQYHHPDYSKPDMIVTLCRSCHIELHMGQG